MYDGTDKCTVCGKETDKLTCVDEVTFVCDHCLENFEKCDICGEYWDGEVVEMHYLDDGRCVCDNCIEDVEDEEEEDEENE